DRSGSEGSERTRGFVGGAEESRLPVQANWLGSWTAVAMALQRSRRGGLASDLRRDAAHAGGADGTDDAGGALPPGACEDVTQSETSDAADPSPVAAVQGHRP